MEGRPARALALVAATAAWCLLARGLAEGGGARFHADVSPRQAHELTRSERSAAGLVILDVRTPAEYRAERLEGAVLLDYRSPDFRGKLTALDRGAAYLVYCRTASRSRAAVDMMAELGFTTVYHMTGGIMGWKMDGLPTVP